MSCTICSKGLSLHDIKRTKKLGNINSIIEWMCDKIKNTFQSKCLKKCMEENNSYFICSPVFHQEPDYVRF
jgi:hypothetical protein